MSREDRQPPQETGAHPMTDLKAQVEKLVGEWRAGKMGTDASVRVAELACADQLAAVLAGGEKEVAEMEMRLRAALKVSESNTNYWRNRATAREAREHGLLEAGRSLISRIGLWRRGVAEGIEVLAVASELAQALAAYPPSEKEGEKS